MSNAKATISYRYLVIPAIFALLTWVADVRADSGSVKQRSPNYRHGKAMHDFAGNVLHGLLRNQKELGLSKEQSSKVKAIEADYAKSRIQGEADVKLAELDIRTRIRDEKADLSSIEAALRKSESVRTALRLDGVKALREATAILTPEQQEKWHQSMLEKRKPSTRWKEHKDQNKKMGREGLRMMPHELPEKEG